MNKTIFYSNKSLLQLALVALAKKSKSVCTETNEDYRQGKINKKSVSSTAIVFEESDYEIFFSSGFKRVKVLANAPYKRKAQRSISYDDMSTSGTSPTARDNLFHTPRRASYTIHESANDWKRHFKVQYVTYTDMYKLLNIPDGASRYIVDLCILLENPRYISKYEISWEDAKNWYEYICRSYQPEERKELIAKLASSDAGIEYCFQYIQRGIGMTKMRDINAVSKIHRGVVQEIDSDDKVIMMPGFELYETIFHHPKTSTFHSVILYRIDHRGIMILAHSRQGNVEELLQKYCRNLIDHDDKYVIGMLTAPLYFLNPPNLNT